MKQKTTHLYLNESNERIINQTDTFRLSEVTYSSFGEPIQMYRFEIKVNNQFIFVRRVDKSSCLPPYNYNADLLRMYIEHIDLKRGFYSLYGKPENEFDGHVDTAGSPEYQMKFAEQYPFAEFTDIDKIGNGIWKFYGNHEGFSAVFQYIIWDEKLAMKIKSQMQKLKAKGKKSS